jgi:hypothetical protein
MRLASSATAQRDDQITPEAVRAMADGPSTAVLAAARYLGGLDALLRKWEREDNPFGVPDEANDAGAQAAPVVLQRCACVGARILVRPDHAQLFPVSNLTFLHACINKFLCITAGTDRPFLYPR